MTEYDQLVNMLQRADVKFTEEDRLITLVNDVGIDGHGEYWTEFQFTKEGELEWVIGYPA